MKYYATIYIDPILDFEGATHAFLGLTKGKSPDELDKIDKELRDKKLKNADWKDFDKKWYESLETNEFNDGFMALHLWNLMLVIGVESLKNKTLKRIHA